MTVNYQTNIKRLYAFNFFWMFLVLIPVIIPYFLKLGLSMQEIFWLQACFGLTVAIFEVPSGYLCDLWGRRKCLLLGAFISALGFSWLYFAQTFSTIIITELLLGLGSSLVSGTDLSLLYDSFYSKNKPEGPCDSERSPIANRVANLQFFSVTAEAIASLIGGFLAGLSFSAVVTAQLIVAWLPLAIAFSLKEPPYQKMSKSKHMENFKKIWAQLFNSDPLIKLIFINLVIWGLATFIAVWIFQKYWTLFNINLMWFGPLWFSYNFVVGVVGKFAPFFERKLGPISLLISLSLLPIIGHFGMAWALTHKHRSYAIIIGVGFGLCFQVGRGLTQVILRDALNWRLPSESRATSNSLASLFFRLGFVILGPITGYIIDRHGMDVALFLLGIFFIILFMLFMLPLAMNVSKIVKAKRPIFK